YMFRLMAMTFFGTYRGPAWETHSRADVATAAIHGVSHPADPHAHGKAHKKTHEVSHGPADLHDSSGPGHHAAHADDAHGRHGHGPWDGPHESPQTTTLPLLLLA